MSIRSPRPVRPRPISAARMDEYAYSPRTNIRDRNPDLRRKLLAPRQTDHARLGLHQHVVRFLVAIGPVRPISRNSTPDESRLVPSEVLIPAPEPFHRACRQVVNENIRSRDQPPQRRRVLLHIQHDAALPAIEPREIRRQSVQRTVVMPRRIALRPLDLDHLRAHIGQLPRTERRRHGLLQRDDA